MYQSFLQQKEMHSRQSEISRICFERRISSLVHFTRIENLASILNLGLLPRSELETRYHDLTPVFNDKHRLDGHPEAISLSIGYPNWRMFHKYSHANKEEWVVLLLRPDILWEKDCAFLADNAASNNIRWLPLDVCKRPKSLMGLFDDFADLKRETLKLPVCYPTNPQAEVLVFEPIPPMYIFKVYFFDQQAYKEWADQNKIPLKLVRISKRFFRPRKDYKLYQIPAYA